MHVRDVDLATADDMAVWEFAKLNGLAIVSKRRFSPAQLPPWLPTEGRLAVCVGNRSTEEIHLLVRQRATDFVDFDSDPVAALLVLSP